MASDFPNTYSIGIFACCKSDCNPTEGELNHKVPVRGIPTPQFREQSIYIPTHSSNFDSNQLSSQKKNQNFMFLFDRTSEHSETTMIKDLTNILQKINKNTLGIELISALSKLVDKHQKYELINNKTAQPLKLVYQDKIVTKTIAYIFENSEYTNDWPEWDNSVERAEKARLLFKDVLQFDDVQVY